MGAVFLGGSWIPAPFHSPRRPLFARWSTIILYVLLIWATLPLTPMLWVPIRDGIGRPAPLALSTLIVLGGAWVVWKVLAVRENQTPLRGLALGGCALVFGFFIWKLENPVEEVHFFEYGFLSYLAFHALRSARETQGIWTRRAWTLALSFAVGLADEGIQSLLPNRFGDIRDVGFNLLAGLLGLVVTELLLSGRARETAVETPR